MTWHLGETYWPETQDTNSPVKMHVSYQARRTHFDMVDDSLFRETLLSLGFWDFTFYLIPSCCVCRSTCPPVCFLIILVFSGWYLRALFCYLYLSVYTFSPHNLTKSHSTDICLSVDTKSTSATQIQLLIPNSEAHVCVLNCFSHVWLFASLWTIASQAPLFTGFSRQEQLSGLPCPSPGIFPTQGQNSHLLYLPH